MMTSMRVYLGSDHAGFELKAKLFAHLFDAGPEESNGQECNPVGVRSLWRFGPLLLLVLAMGCAGAPTGGGAAAPSSSAAPVAAAPRLVSAPPALRDECEKAAAELGFAVPCPSQVPVTAGEPATCRGSCVAKAGGGETLDDIFFLEVADFDGGDVLGPVAHLAIEARRVDRAPPVPCYGGSVSERFTVPGVTVLECPDSSADSQAHAQHGEGVHEGHLLGYWDVDGVRYVVSVHEASTLSQQFLTEVVDGVELVTA